MKNLLTFKFWLAVRPGELMPTSQSILLISAGLLFAGGLAAWQWRRRQPGNPYRRVLSRLSAFGFTNAAINLVLLFFAYEAVPVLSMRLWFLLWLLSMAAWLYFVWQEAKAIPQLQAQAAERRKFKQYLP